MTRNIKSRAARLEIDERLTFLHNQKLKKPHAPFELSERIVNEIPNIHGKILVIADCGLLSAIIKRESSCDITFICFQEKEYEFAKKLCVDDVKLFQTPSMEIIQKELKDMKFDIIVGNPPYQSASKTGNTKKSGATGYLWDKFVKFSLDHLNNGGYLAYIHPCVWRKPGSDMWPILMQYQIEWIEMHPNHPNAALNSSWTGPNIFGVATAFDAYVLRKIPYTKPTKVISFHEKEYEIDLSKLEWLAGEQFKIIQKILANADEKRCEVIADSSYHTSRRDYINKEKTSKFKYPCLTAVHSNNVPKFYYSSVKDKGHFGIPKVVFGNGGHVYPINDYNGNLAVTENGIAIVVSSKKECELIIRALNTDTFKCIVWTTKWSNFQTDRKMFTYFKKDWYKIILEEEQKRIEREKKNA